MRKNIFVVGLAGIFIGLLIALATYEGIHRTGDDNFCSICHEMRPMVAAYENDVHGGKGKTGIKVSCVNCHLPQDNIFNYIATKAKNGAIEVGIHVFGDPDAIDWQEKRKHRKDFVYDGGCINCHTTFKTNKSISDKGLEMHKHYEKLKNTDKRLACASCHNEIGHTGLRSNLNYYKPEYKFYNGKLDKKRNEIDNKLTEELEKE